MTQIKDKEVRIIDKATLKTPPGPSGHFLFGSVNENIKDPLTLNYNAWKQYGDYVRFKAIPGTYWYMFSHPDAVQYILNKNMYNYKKPDFFYKTVSLLAGNGILTSEGDLWKKQRKLSQPAFNRKYLDALSYIMVKSTEELISKWEQYKEGTEIDVLEEMMNLALQNVSKALFSVDISDSANEFGSALRVAFSHVSDKMNNPMATPQWMPTEKNRKFTVSKDILDKVVDDIISNRAKNPSQASDLLTMLMSARDEDSNEGMTSQQLKDEVLTLIIAGHETVGASLSWTWYLLGQNKEIANQLAEEIKSVLDGRSPTVEDLPKMPYAKMVFEESMRLYPPAWGIPRQTIEEDEINGFYIPKNAIMTLSQYVTHRHDDFWEKPLDFYPDHFTSENVAKRHKFAYFPFGAGPRMCIGIHFAMIEAQLVLITLLQRFDFDLVPGQTVIPDPTFTLRPRDGVMITIKKRK